MAAATDNSGHFGAQGYLARMDEAQEKEIALAGEILTVTSTPDQSR
jgi:hypothetical protein